MAVAAEQVAEIAGIIGGGQERHKVVEHLRASYPALQFSSCSEDDITEDVEPAAVTEAFELYLLDGSGHCLRLTGDPEAATGLVLAEKVEG